MNKSKRDLKEPDAFEVIKEHRKKTSAKLTEIRERLQQSDRKKVKN